MSVTRSGEQVSLQIGKMGTVTGLQDGDFVMTKLDVGWDSEIIKAVKQTSLSSIN